MEIRIAAPADAEDGARDRIERLGTPAAEHLRYRKAFTSSASWS